MKCLKVIGVTYLITGMAAAGAWVYNGIREEQMNKSLWDEMIVQKYNPEEYNRLKSAKNDYKTWAEAAQHIVDSLNIESQSTKLRFQGEQLLNDTVKTAYKTIK